MASPNNENGCYSIWKKTAEFDVRKIIHSLKVGLALTLVSLFYYFKPVYDGFGISAIWAVLSVIVVFEYSVGATIGRGLNRMLATLVGSGLGFGAHWMATHSGKSGEPILIAIFVFIFAAVVTYIRFSPEMKKRYDYGLLILILTFCLISVSGYRDDEVLRMAHTRVSTIAIGAATAVIICILICPVWIGEDLQNSVAANLDKLGSFLQEYGSKSSGVSNGKVNESTNNSHLEAYKSVLNSKNSEESMANLARWEPCHGRFMFRHPWKQYLKVGTLSRQCAYKIEVLSSYLHSEIQLRDQFHKQSTPTEIDCQIEEICRKMSSESGKALKELSSTIKTMKISPSLQTHLANAKDAQGTLKSLLKIKLWDSASVATIASILIDIVTCTQQIEQSVQKLALLAKFKSLEPHLPPVSDESYHVVNIN